MTELESKFCKAFREMDEKGKEALGFVDHRLWQMVSRYGIIETVKRLIKVPPEKGAFTKLWESKHLDLSIEALVIKREYRDLFTKEEIDNATYKLKEYGYFNGYYKIDDEL